MRRIIEERPWGYYQVLLESVGMKLKELVIYPKQKLSLQKHFQRDEKWIIIEGEGLLTLNEDVSEIRVDDIRLIPRNCWHRVENISSVHKLIILETQTGNYLEEDDIQRKEDDYGRL